jgi:high-affinity K+ transport system ATPase subunit B
MMTWLYILSGGFALYSVEMADPNQPLPLTMSIALLLCLIPSTLDALPINRRKKMIPSLLNNLSQGKSGTE